MAKMKKAEMGMLAKPKVKATVTITKKPAAPAKKYPILADEGDNYSETMKREAEMKKKGIYKMGGALKPVPANKKGLSKLPTAVRNKMGFQKMGGATKKAKDGTSLGMKSVKAGYDSNPGVTRADFVSMGKGEAKMGKSVKKCRYGCK
jgi:hypothetical protein